MAAQAQQLEIPLDETLTSLVSAVAGSRPDPRAQPATAPDAPARVGPPPGAGIFLGAVLGLALWLLVAGLVALALLFST
jgi:hypothetical protein